MPPSCDFTAPVASVWLNFMSLIVSNNSAVVRSDHAITAKVQLQETIAHLKTIEKTLRDELQTSAAHVRAAQKTQAKTTLQHILMRARTKRVRLTQTTNKRVNMEQQLDALCMSELNNQVLSSMQKTSIALKSLGVKESVENADEMMLDMQEAHEDLSAMQDALGQPISFDNMDEDTLARELEILLADDEDALLEMPVSRNSMSLQPQKQEADANSAPKTEVAQETRNPKEDRDAEATTVAVTE